MEQCSRCFQHQEGAELGLNGMDNLCELLINVVNAKQAKDADRLAPKGEWSGLEVTISSNVDTEPSAKRQVLTHSGIYAERGNPVIFLCEKGKQTVRRAEKVAGIGNGRKRMLCCNGRDKG